MVRNAQRARPALESLEERQLLDGSHGNPMGPFGEPINEKDLEKYNVQIVNHTAGSTVNDRRKIFTTPEGGRVVLILYGVGTLKGTTQDPDGALNIVFDDTNENTQITGRVFGGNGRAKIRTFRDADVPLESLSVSDNRLGSIRLGQFDLVDGGVFNVSGGVRTVQLNSIGAATLVDLQSLPVQSSQLTDQIEVGAQRDIIQWIVAPGGTVEIAGVGGLQAPGAIGVGGAASTGGDEAFTTRITSSGQVELIPTAAAADTGQRVPPPGVNLLVDRIEGLGGAVALANPQVFGYDPTANALIRFDARSGAALQAIPLNSPVPANLDAGVALARVDGVQVVLVGTGLTVQVFDIVTGTFQGAFSAANLAPDGFTQITGIGSTDQGTGLVDGFSDLVQPIDVAQSLATGVAVPSGAAFRSGNGFNLSGGATGVAGAPLGYLTGAATFNTFQPLTPFFGIMTVNTNDNQITEDDRTQITSPATLTNDVPPNNTPFAFGSIGSFPALVTSVGPIDPNNPSGAMGNVLTLYNPIDLSPAGTVTLQYGNRLTGLSESFHPEVTGAAVINVRGVLNQIAARSVQGAVVDTLGFLAQIRVGTAVDSAFVGLPVGHVDIANRQNVTITSSATRPVGKRGGVFTVPGLRPVGPIAPPVIRPEFNPATATPTGRRA